MKNLIIIGHPNTESFCYDGIFKTVKETLNVKGESTKVIDLYADEFSRPRTNLIENYIEFISYLLYGGLG